VHAQGRPGGRCRAPGPRGGRGRGGKGEGARRGGGDPRPRRGARAKPGGGDRAADRRAAPAGRGRGREGVRQHRPDDGPERCRGDRADVQPGARDGRRRRADDPQPADGERRGRPAAGVRRADGRAEEGGALADAVIAIFGPTASGKSAVAEALAERIPAELVSADAMQAYRGLPILTNQSGAAARLVAIWPLEHEGSVGEYAALAHAAVDEILASGRTPVVVGGTGLYLRAALAELALPPAPGPGARRRWEQFYDEHGPAGAHARLEELDPGAAAAVHRNDRRRVVRALELADAGASLAAGRDRLWAAETRHPTL